jgi:hypothetical protein
LQVCAKCSGKVVYLFWIKNFANLKSSATFISLMQPLAGWPASEKNKSIIFQGSDVQKVSVSMVGQDPACRVRHEGGGTPTVFSRLS